MKNAASPRAPAALALLLGWSIAQAAPFADPTRPPGTGELQPDGGAVAGPRLESVLIGVDRRIAIISGQAVHIGGAFNGGKIVRITESEVAIRTGARTEVLKLFPDVEKQPRAKRVRGAVR